MDHIDADLRNVADHQEARQGVKVGINLAKQQEEYWDRYLPFSGEHRLQNREADHR
jgi:hypothetical protein